MSRCSTRTDAETGSVDVSWYVEGTGKVLTRTFRINIPDDQFPAFPDSGFDTLESIDGTGAVEAFRVVVQDRTTGAAGTVTVPLPAGIALATHAAPPSPGVAPDIK